MAADRIPEFVHEICRMDKFGGRCLRTSATAWEIMDVHQWTEEHNTALRHKFPRIQATVVANRKSLSGFSVVLQTHRVSHAWVSILVCAIMVTAIAALSRALWAGRH